MAPAVANEPHQIPVSDPNLPLILFRNEMDALQVACKNLEVQLHDVLFDSSDAQPLMDAASETVFKTNHLFSRFLHEFYFPLKWSQNYSEKEIEELLDHVPNWYQEFQHHVDFLYNFPHQPQVQQTLDAMKRSHLYNSLVTNVQPPRAVKRDTKFDTSVRSLHDNKKQGENGAGNGNVEASQFKIFILNDAEATRLFQNWQTDEHKANVNSSSNPNPTLNTNMIRPSELLNLGEPRNILRRKKSPKNQNEEADSINQAFGGLKVNSPVKNCMDMLERKFCLLYTKTVVIDGVAMETWCMSLPFVLMSNSQQRCAALATIFWDTYFKTEGNWLPFQVKREITWEDLSAALIHYFKAQTNTQWNLTAKNLQYIGKKVFNRTNFTAQSKVDRKEFCLVKETSMTTWKYLFSILELIKKHLAPFWNSGAIVGFIDRAEAENLIRSQDVGTVLVRFSDSLAGGVSYTVCMKPNPKYPTGIFSVAPLSDPASEGARDLKLLSLDQRIMTSNEFTDVLYFEPGSNYPALMPKGKMFTRPAEPATETVTNGTASGSKTTPYGQPIIFSMNDPNASQVQTPVTTEPRTATVKAEALNGNGGEGTEHGSDMVTSTSVNGSSNASPGVCSACQNHTHNQNHQIQMQNQIHHQIHALYQNNHAQIQTENHNWNQIQSPHQIQNYYQTPNPISAPSQIYYQNPHQNQNHHETEMQYQNPMEMEYRPQDYLFNNVNLMDVTMEMNMELAELPQYNLTSL